MSHKVVILGSGAVVKKLEAIFADHGFQRLYDQALYNEAELVVDLHLGLDEEKKAILRTVESLIGSDVPIYTSVLHHTATEVASWLKVPERVVGFSPLAFDQMDHVEVSRPLQAEEEPHWDSKLTWFENLGKKVEIVTDEPGLIFPRTLALIVNEATYALSEGIATKEDIDLAMKKGTNYPYGPFEWADLVGVDHIFAVLSALHRELGDDRYRPAPLLRKMIYAGHFGISVGRGFYRYDG